MTTVVGGNQRYPNLQEIADLFRSTINDDMAGASDTPGEGLIATNTSPFLLKYIRSATRDLFSDLRNIGDPALILDNYLLLNIPPLAAENPAVRVMLSYAGFYNGFTWNNSWLLPLECQRVERLWERWSNTNAGFTPMEQVQSLPGTYQTQRMSIWAMEQNSIVMPGCLMNVDLRIRCRIALPPYLNPATLDFPTTYVPILDSTNAIVDKMTVRYSRRFAPDQYATSKDAAADSLEKLKLEIVRQQQSISNQRTPYGEEATGSLGWQYWQL